MQTPAQVAQQANVTAQTIRNYSREFAELLSPSAHGKDGPRLYTDEDVETLCTIAALRKSGLRRDEVMERIRHVDVPSVVDVEPEPQNDTQTSLQESLQSFLAPQTVQSSVTVRFEAIERRFLALEDMQTTLLRAALLWGVLLGAIGAFALGAFILWVIWLTINLGAV